MIEIFVIHKLDTIAFDLSNGVYKPQDDEDQKD